MHQNYFYSHCFIHSRTYINTYNLHRDSILGLICSQTLNLAVASQNSRWTICIRKNYWEKKSNFTDTVSLLRRSDKVWKLWNIFLQKRIYFFLFFIHCKVDSSHSDALSFTLHLHFKDSTNILILPGTLRRSQLKWSLCQDPLGRELFHTSPFSKHKYSNIP